MTLQELAARVLYFTLEHENQTWQLRVHPNTPGGAWTLRGDNLNYILEKADSALRAEGL
jgi:hypothetical protein